MTSKERAQLKGLAANEDTIVQVGKGGITDSVIASVNTALSARELVKGRVLESSLLSSREACESLASACGAEPVQAIGNCFVLYKKNPDKKPEKKPERSRQRSRQKSRQKIRQKSPESENEAKGNCRLRGKL